MLRAITVTTIILINTAGLAGCSSIHRLPDGGENIKQVYDRHMTGADDTQVGGEISTEDDIETACDNCHKEKQQRQINDKYVDLAPYTRSVNNEMQNLFPLLPNPQLIMYVDPHLSKKGHPVPGYCVPFRLYEKDEYALPGEVRK